MFSLKNACHKNWIFLLIYIVDASNFYFSFDNTRVVSKCMACFIIIMHASFNNSHYPKKR